MPCLYLIKKKPTELKTSRIRLAAVSSILWAKNGGTLFLD